MFTFLGRAPLKTIGIASVAVVSIASGPVLANSSANSAASADVTKPLEEIQSDPIGSSDTRFRELFANWTALDSVPTIGPDAPIPGLEQATVSVPSIMPVRNARMSSGYGMRNHPVLRRRKHHAGVDLAAPTGTPVYATANGLVGRADWFSSYGLYISIDHGADLETRYAHLSRLAVAAGDRVEKGDLIGYVGSTGRSTGPHLHYEVRVDGVAVNPIPYMVESNEQARMAGSRTSRQGDILEGRRRVGAGGQ